MYSLQLLGGVALQGETGPVTGPVVQRRRLALLAMLAAAPTGALSRDKLIAYFWPDEDRERARHFLADSLFVLRRALGKDSVLAAGDDLVLNAELLRSDVGRFHAALAAGDREQAVALYRGPFLDGFFVADAPEFERWVEAERDRLARLYAAALEGLAEEREQADDHPGALGWWRRAAAHDPFSSRIALRLMHAAAAAGDPAGAIQHARVHAALLREELGVEPEREIAALVERLCAGPAAPAGAGQEPALPAAEAPPPPPPAAQTPPARSPSPARFLLPRRRRGRAALALLGGVMLALAADPPASRQRVGPAAHIESIAVLPFANLSGDPGDDYFGEGMSEELIGTLATVDGLKVAARTSAFQFKEGAADVREIGEKLGVQAVLEGSVRRSGDRLRVAVQLIDAGSGYHLWREDFDRRVADAVGIQQEIAQEVVRALHARFPPRRGLAGRARAPDPEAHVLYLKGRYAWNQWTGQGQARALNFFRASIARDPAYAKPHAGLADTYVVLGSSGYLPGPEAFAAARAEAEKALALDETLAEAHTSLAAVLAWERDFPGAEEAFRRAIELNPSYPTAHHGYAMLLAMRGDTAAALRQLGTAQRLDPLSLSVSQARGLMLYLARDYPAAVEQARRALELEPSSPWALDILGVSYSMLDRHGEAVRALEAARAAAPEDPEILTDLAVAHARAGNRAQAREILGRMERPAKGGPDAFRVAQIHAALGDRDRALEWLERTRWDMLSLVLIRTDPSLDPLRRDPRFARLLNTLGPA